MLIIFYTPLLVWDSPKVHLITYHVAKRESSCQRNAKTGFSSQLDFSGYQEKESDNPGLELNTQHKTANCLKSRCYQLTLPSVKCTPWCKNLNKRIILNTNPVFSILIPMICFSLVHKGVFCGIVELCSGFLA